MDTPTLKHLMGAYFHEDFNEVHGGPWETVSAFLETEPEDAAALVEEINEVLRQLPSEADVDTYLFDLGCAYLPTAQEGGYRGWLATVAAYVSARSGGTS